MSTEFNLIGNQNPSFFSHFKPLLGDFSLKKSHSSELVKGLGDKLNGSVVSGDSFVNNWYFKGTGFFPSTVESKAAAGVVNALSKGNEVSARTTLPIRDFALVNVRRGVRVPRHETAAEEVDAVMGAKRVDRTTGIGLHLLVVNKIGIEHITKVKSNGEKIGPGPKYSEVADACLEVKKQLELIRAENGPLSKALSDLRSDIASGKMDFLPCDRNKYAVGADRSGNGVKKSSEMKGFGMKASMGEGKEELKEVKGAKLICLAPIKLMV